MSGHAGLVAKKKSTRGKNKTVQRTYWVKAAQLQSKPLKLESRDGKKLAAAMGRLGSAAGRWAGSSAGMHIGAKKAGTVGSLFGGAAGYKAGAVAGHHTGSMAGYLVGRKVDQRTAGALAHGAHLLSYAVDGAHAFTRVRALQKKLRTP
jgi:hypothetical protein